MKFSINKRSSWKSFLERIISFMPVFLYRVSWGWFLLWIINPIALVVPVGCRPAVVYVAWNIELLKLVRLDLFTWCPHGICNHRHLWWFLVQRLWLHLTSFLQFVFHLYLLIHVDALLKQWLHWVSPMIQIFVITERSHHLASASFVLHLVVALAWLLELRCQLISVVAHLLLLLLTHISCTMMCCSCCLVGVGIPLRLRKQALKKWRVNDLVGKQWWRRVMILIRWGAMRILMLRSNWLLVGGWVWGIALLILAA